MVQGEGTQGCAVGYGLAGVLATHQGPIAKGQDISSGWAITSGEGSRRLSFSFSQAVTIPCKIDSEVHRGIITALLVKAPFIVTFR